MSEEQAHLLRLLTSMSKLTTGRQAWAVPSEIFEAFGGAGYVEDTGLPVLLRDSQVMPIWEGTTNVLSLDTLRALGKGESWKALKRQIEQSAQTAQDARLVEAAKVALGASVHAEAWLAGAMRAGQAAVEAGARRFALTAGRALELALLIAQAQWSLDHEHDGRARAAALRFARSGVDLIVEEGAEQEAFALANDEPLGIEKRQE